MRFSPCWQTHRLRANFPKPLRFGYNYQIEHHLWPRLPMLRYRELQPKVEALCQKHGIPYVRQNVFVRVGKLLDLMVGKAQMKVVKTDI